MDILHFNGEHRWLSNFWPCSVELGGMHFNSVEAAYVASKTLCMETRKKVQALEKPGDCKRFGRTLKLRDDWDVVKIDIMRDLIRQKFSQGSELGERLVSTGDCQIVEGNTWGDTFWGVCRGLGENHLGKLIMERRRELVS